MQRRREGETVNPLNQTSAKIYQFPVGGRSGPSRREPNVADAGSHNVLTCASWYHEAALLEEQTRKPQ
ncbi:DUF2735 domain-containing protein [Rhodopseudomonas pseudopalustris]|uniref:DUF2735 domain-containing protein n=1 Tax=Rhodopseudomonas pseudopalustris TaxID=1513892 RepID=UPI0015880A84|nr:DUF2735 domain-containing protein [Rhodopseudomonas pseudopalustris]